MRILQTAGRAASVGKSRAAVLSQAGAPLSWTSEQADTLFVCERVRKAAAQKRQPQRAERATYTEGAEEFFPLRATSSKRAREASTSPSGELWDEVGGFSMFAPPICRRR
jgi:hypothetical protein